MTTRLDNGRTRFLPFNQGRDGGAGNPDAREGGFATSYIWEEVWSRDLWLELLGRFVTAMPGAGGEVIFPRWHQLRAVRRLVAHARDNGSGHNYLVQHSAGSGKSNTIAWTAIRLATLHGVDGAPVFDSVIVISDRRALDRQLQATVAAFEPAPGFVETITQDSRQLATVLLGGARVVVSTIQKFNTENLRAVGGLGGRRFAVIVDEAHSGQSGESADALQRVLGAEAEGLEGVNAAIAARRPQRNISYLAFTATPRNVTLERFGLRGPDGLPQAFDLYPMRQAIEEGFILDVLANYMPYEVLYRIEKAVEEDPRFGLRRGPRSIARFVELHPHHVAQKVEVVVEHFRAHVRHRLGGQAKAMVVTSSREAAVRWWLGMREYITERGYDDVSALVAFSGEVDVDGQAWTEGAANDMPEAAVPEALDGPGFNVLLVAEKYQTGFDQPKLVAMYVDKHLAGVTAVQTLSRLNRCYPGKDTTIVVDFRNTVEEIQDAFRPYFEATVLESATDPNQVYGLRDRLLAFGFVHEEDVDAFSEVLYGIGTDYEKRPLLEELARRCVNRFAAAFGNGAQEAEREEFRQLGSSFVRFYSFVASAWTVNEPDLEKLHAYMVWVNRLLPRPDGGADAEITEDMIRLVASEVRPGAVVDAALAPGSGTRLAGINDFGARGWSQEEELELSTLVRAFNERHGLDLRPEDAAVLVRAGEEVRDDPAMAAILRNNPRDIGEREFRNAFEDRAAEGFERHRQFGTAFMQDEGFRAAMASLVYGAIMRGLPPPPR
jgi:type I restriction enzyme R subunit